MLSQRSQVLERYALRNSLSKSRSSGWRKLKQFGLFNDKTMRDLDGDPRAKKKREREANFARQRKNWIKHIQNMTVFRFRRMYRMSHDCFMKLYEKIAPKITIQSNKARGGVVWPVIKLAATLRFLAGGSYLDITESFGIGDATLYAAIWRVLEAIDATFGMTFPSQLNDLVAIEERFASTSKAGIRGCVGAVDGLLVKVVTPPKGRQPRRFYTRKRFHAFNVQVASHIIDS